MPWVHFRQAPGLELRVQIGRSHRATCRRCCACGERLRPCRLRRTELGRVRRFALVDELAPLDALVVRVLVLALLAHDSGRVRERLDHAALRLLSYVHFNGRLTEGVSEVPRQI